MYVADDANRSLMADRIYPAHINKFGWVAIDLVRVFLSLSQVQDQEIYEKMGFNLGTFSTYEKQIS